MAAASSRSLAQLCLLADVVALWWRVAVRLVLDSLLVGLQALDEVELSKILKQQKQIYN